jgi:DNA polymerase-1
VPFDIISEYACIDAEITLQLGLYQLDKIEGLSKITNIKKVYENEKKLVRVAFDMEFHGITINRAFCGKAFNYEKSKQDEAANRFEELSGHELVDSGKALAKAFDAVGELYPVTAKGNPSFKAEFLESLSTPLARELLAYRKAQKLANTYYANFIKFADKDDRIHASINLAGTSTGRFSMSEPNLQNLTRTSEEDLKEVYTVRRAFVPSSQDHCFVMIDYQAMEFRLMLDLAGEKGVINKILTEGLDVHQATANQMKVSRQEAKTLNFMLLYGGGIAKLATSLGLSEKKAKDLRDEYFEKLPKVGELIKRTIHAAKVKKKLQNWAGFIYHFPDSDFAYVAPNHIIQGSCAQIIRFAMTEIAPMLQGTKSKMLLQIHDELLFEFHRDDLHMISVIKETMEKIYQHKYLPMACEVSHSWKSWADKQKGLPICT